MKSIVRKAFVASAATAAVLAFSCHRAHAQATADKPAPIASATSDSDLDTQFLDALGRLTAARLDFANRINQKVADTYSPEDIVDLQQQAKAVQTIMDEAKKSGHVDWFALQLAQARVSKRTTELDWKKAAALRQRSPDAVSDADVEMAHLRAQLADLNLRRGQAVATKSPDERLTWAVESLFIDVQSLQDKVQSLEERE
jgi:hypothetical protein